MADYCIICECEPVEAKPEGMMFGWMREIDGFECICPWCIRDLLKEKGKLEDL